LELPVKTVELSQPLAMFVAGLPTTMASHKQVLELLSSKVHRGNDDDADSDI